MVEILGINQINEIDKLFGQPQLIQDPMEQCIYYELIRGKYNKPLCFNGFRQAQENTDLRENQNNIVV